MLAFLTFYGADRSLQGCGDLFAGELMGHVARRLRVRGNKVVQEEALLGDLDERIRSVAAGPDGYIYGLTDSNQGRLLRLRPGMPSAAQAARVAKPF
jgi:glucose/arabinose dehydrogenase